MRTFVRVGVIWSTPWAYQSIAAERHHGETTLRFRHLAFLLRGALRVAELEI